MKRFFVEDDIINNEKVFGLPADAFRFWVFCLCIANRQDPRGSLPPVRGIAFRARVTVADAASMVDQLIDYRLIDQDADGLLRIHDWDKHQVKERDWAAIKAAQRARVNGAPNDVHVDVHVDNGKCPRGQARGQAQDVHSMSTSKEGSKEGSNPPSGEKEKRPPLTPPKPKRTRTGYRPLTDEQRAKLMPAPEAPDDGT